MEPNSSHSRSPWAIVIVVALLVIAVLIAVWLRRVGLLRLPNGPAEMVPADITELDKLKMVELENPVGTSTESANLSVAEKQKALGVIAPSGKSANLSAQEKASLLDDLNPR